MRPVTVSDFRQALLSGRITQDALAREAGVSRTYVCHWLAGRRRAPRVRAAAERLLTPHPLSVTLSVTLSPHA